MQRLTDTEKGETQLVTCRNGFIGLQCRSCFIGGGALPSTQQPTNSFFHLFYLIQKKIMVNFSGVVGSIGDAFSRAATAVKDDANAAESSVDGAFTAVVGGVKNAGSYAFQRTEDIATGVENPVGGFVAKVEGAGGD